MISVPDLNPEKIDAVILCGGLGTRLRNVVNDRPKVMAEIDGRPFLDILIDYIAGHGFRRFILCVGYMSAVIKSHYKGKGNLTILFSEEKELLGTAGAIKNAEPLISSNPFMIVNGDSFCNLDIRDFLAFHIEKKADISVALVHPEKDADYGVVVLDRSQRIISFNEKIKPDASGYINAGMYFFERKMLGLIPRDASYSLEYDFFPKAIRQGIYGYVTEEKLFDIGTPERYRLAEIVLGKRGK